MATTTTLTGCPCTLCLSDPCPCDLPSSFFGTFGGGLASLGTVTFNYSASGTACGFLSKADRFVATIAGCGGGDMIINFRPSCNWGEVNCIGGGINSSLDDAISTTCTPLYHLFSSVSLGSGPCAGTSGTLEIHT